VLSLRGLSIASEPPRWNTPSLVLRSTRV
jgi:hypothetical protein